MSELALQRIREAKEQRLTRLDLGNCGLTELPDELFELTWLEELNLNTSGHYMDIKDNFRINFLTPNKGNENKIYVISQNIKLLKNLKRLFINRMPFLSDLSPLKGLINLEQLDISSTQVSDLTPLKALSNLQILYVNHTNIFDLDPLSNCLKLQLLDAQYTEVYSLKPLELLIDLRLLYLGNTNVTDLSPIKNHKKIKWFSIEKTKITNPPKEIAYRGIVFVRNYFKQIEKQKGTVELYEAKLIIIGEGGTGKTTLFEKLINNNHQIGNTPETHGINIYEGLPFKHTHIGDNTFHANLWDFGGQELQYMTHQFFLTPRALYVLMMDARRESPNLAYWFKIISLLGRDREDSTEKVQLLLVFNKRGNTTGTPLSIKTN